MTTTLFDGVCDELRQRPRRWLITGVAGFIGSNLLEALLRLDQHVVGIDNFSTGSRVNLDEVRREVGETGRFTFHEGDIVSPDDCAIACAGVDIVLHQAALGSVPRSIADPLSSHRANVDGFVNMYLAARDGGARRFVYASSSSVYGDHAALPKVEAVTGLPLSPYAATKVVNELYAGVFARAYSLPAIGLRYFNVFGRRQSPDGAYAAVIPRWIDAMIAGRPCTIFGNGETSRDFCYVDNVVQANILAAVTNDLAALNEAYNIAVGDRTTLNELHDIIREAVAAQTGGSLSLDPIHEDPRPGDIAHSRADIGKAELLLGYRPSHDLRRGMAEAVDWYTGALRSAR